MKKQTALIVGGSSGLGLKLGHLLSEGHQVFVTGRRDPKQKDVIFVPLELGGGNLAENLDSLSAICRTSTSLYMRRDFTRKGKSTSSPTMTSGRWKMSACLLPSCSFSAL